MKYRNGVEVNWGDMVYVDDGRIGKVKGIISDKNLVVVDLIGTLSKSVQMCYPANTLVMSPKYYLGCSIIAIQHRVLKWGDIGVVRRMGEYIGYLTVDFGDKGVHIVSGREVALHEEPPMNKLVGSLIRVTRPLNRIGVPTQSNQEVRWI